MSGNSGTIELGLDAPQYLFSTPAGHRLARSILRPQLPYDPHDAQLEGICKAVDRTDIMVLTPTGSGKTGYLTMYMLLMISLAANPELVAPSTKKVRQNPVMVMVFPTNGVEEEMELKFKSHGLKALAINANTVSTVRRRPLGDSTSLLEYKPFWNRFCALTVDEIHLLYSWGLSFRFVFQQIKFVHSQCPPWIVCMALSATVTKGRVMDHICKFLGYKPGKFHIICRSNTQYNVQLIIREFQNGLGGWKFPQLNWVFNEPQKTIIFCPTITLEFHMTIYLWHGAVDRHTLDLMHNDPNLKVLISTDCLCVGFNCKHIRNTVLMGQEKDVNGYVQKVGRPGCDPAVMKDPRGIMYVTKNVASVSKEVIEGTEPKQKTGGNKKGVKMDITMARLVLSDRLPGHIDFEYDNPPEDDPCYCDGCLLKPPSHRPNPCNCSKCCPELVIVQPPRHKSKAVVPMAEQLTEEMRTLGMTRLVSFHDQLWHDADEGKFYLVPPVAFLPGVIIKQILDCYPILHSATDLDMIIGNKTYLAPHHDALWKLINTFEADFIPLWEKAELEKDAVKKVKELVSKRGPGQSVFDSIPPPNTTFQRSKTFASGQTTIVTSKFYSAATHQEPTMESSTIITLSPSRTWYGT
ncbi:hypothetical protein PILCRDRAFT_1984 [Piloderma croceum F 1598]|uniref:DNA 3'-5' helicase n=1 Tax=Piloderma croceum (strain F 1598) TaxID=765440 RepID=A0A0C3GD82_PILCF|nr:hypothetical protein PILCRDRAFT_1984 [Piloderma croceum F 1598]